MLSTIFLGIVTNFVMLNTLGLEHPALRYPLTVLLSYCWFLAFIRIYIQRILLSPSGSSILDFVDVPGGGPRSGSFSNTAEWNGGGGNFSGGGSSGTWGHSDSDEVLSELGSDAGAEAGSAIAGLVEDDGALVVLLVGLLLAVLVFGTGAYFIWYSPEIIAELLLQVILVSGMRKGMKSFSEGEWFRHIFKATKWSFLLVFVLSFGAGVALRTVCPVANSFKEYRLNCAP
jgi:hypothetical protein